MAQWLIADISLLDVHAHLWMLPVTGIISLWFLFSLGDAVTPVEAVAKNMRGELAQARRVTFSAAATAAGTRIKSAWCAPSPPTALQSHLRRLLVWWLKACHRPCGRRLCRSAVPICAR